jgi:uncharacterized protein YqgC (DUF456 family)
MDTATALYILAGVLIAVGVLGVVLPVLPGLPLAFAGMLLAAWVGDFAHIGGWTIGILAALTLLGLAVDVVAGLLGAKRVGASRLAVIGAAVGTLVGLFFGLPGLILGPFIGAFAGEFAQERKTHQAAKVGVATWLGMVFGAVFKLAIAFVMLGVFAFALLV